MGTCICKWSSRGSHSLGDVLLTHNY